jgi:hypothetical protein
MKLLPYIRRDVDVDGRELGRRLSKLNAGQRALIALDLTCGALRLSNLTRSQSAAVAKVSGSTINRARERIILRLGPARVLEIIDRMTAPPTLVDPRGVARHRAGGAFLVEARPQRIA